jgi:peptide/nickel transport system substrate-binding protein
MLQSPRQRHLRALAALALAAGLLVPAAAPAAAAGPLTLRVATDQKLETLNPWHSVTVADYEVFQIQYEMLVGFGINLEPVPGFADTWSASADKMTHTFHIRDGMKWSDGQPATCEDARWTYQLVLDAVAQEVTLGSGYLEPYLTNTGAKEVTCSGNELTVLTEFPTTLLQQAYIPILPKHIWSQYTMAQIADSTAEGFFVNAPVVVGSGPWVAVEWEPGQFVKLARNVHYWGTPAGPDEIIMQTLASEDAMVQALKAGDVDYVYGTGAEQFDALASEPDIATAEGFSNGYTYLSFNTRATQPGYNGSTSALEDQKFRDALGFAIDRQMLVDRILKGHGVVGTTHVPPYHVNWHVEPKTPRTFDIAEANRRLDAAGYAPGADGRRLDKEGKPIVLRMTWPDSEPHATDAEFIKGWFEQIGIGVDAYETEEGKLYDDLMGPEAGKYDANWDMYMWGWVGDPDPMSLLSFFTQDQIAAGINDCFFTSDRYDELFGLQQRATDEAERKAYIDEMQQIFYDYACYHIPYYDNTLQAYRTDKFAGWTNQPPDSGTPLFGYGYPGYMALVDAAAATPAPTEAPSSAAPSSAAPSAGGEATPAPSAGGGGTATSSDNTTLILGGVIVVIVVVAVGLVLARRRGKATQEDE